MTESLTIIGVRHHSPACARLVAQIIADQKPAYVLVEGPVDMNDRIDELLIGHQLPIAIFTSYRDGTRSHASWSPFCEYSPEWVALTVGRRMGSEIRFIDLPAWHPAFVDRTNRYADAEYRYHEVIQRLCAEFAVDNVDTLWDHLVENEPDDRLAERLDTYFDLLRGETHAGDSDSAREAYMATWINAAVAQAAGRPVVVICGGFHRPALRRLCATPAPGSSAIARPDMPRPNTARPETPWPETPWPETPRPDGDEPARSYLVPYSFHRLDAFEGYQSGMPSPEYYQRLWDHGPAEAAAGLMESVVSRLRRRNQPVSTADLIAARVTAGGLATIRGHRYPSRTDLLDSLVAALVSDALEQPLPWTGRGRLAVGTHPAVVEMVAALSGERTGRLHADTPLPPLVHDVNTTTRTHRLDGAGSTTVDLRVDLVRSHVLHRLRVLGIAGFVRESGPRLGGEAVTTETWNLVLSDGRLVDLIEASAYGPTLETAAAGRLAERIGAKPGVDELATVLFDAVACGIHDLSEQVLATLNAAIGEANETAPLGRALRTFVALWRHDRLLGAARGATMGAAISASVPRLLWLLEGIQGGAEPAQPDRLAAVTALRDAIRHAAGPLDLDRGQALAVMHRVAADAGVPPDLRGAAFGFCWALDTVDDPARALRGASTPTSMGDWLAGLFAVAREQVLDSDASGLIGVLDTIIGGLADTDFLIALPALRQAFTYFPPREREVIANRVLAQRQRDGSGRALLRLGDDPIEVARAYELDSYVDSLLARDGLIQEVAK